MSSIYDQKYALVKWFKATVQDEFIKYYVLPIVGFFGARFFGARFFKIFDSTQAHHSPGSPEYSRLPATSMSMSMSYYLIGSLLNTLSPGPLDEMYTFAIDID